MVHFRLSETFDRFEIDKIEEKRHQNSRYALNREMIDRRRHSSRNHSQNHRGGQERSSSRRRRSRSYNIHGQSRQSLPKSSIKDRLGTPVKKQIPVRQRLSPVPSTSRQDQEPQYFNAQGTPASDHIDGIADHQDMIDMSDLESILNKCMCKCFRMAM